MTILTPEQINKVEKWLMKGSLPYLGKRTSLEKVFASHRAQAAEIERLKGEYARGRQEALVEASLLATRRGKIYTSNYRDFLPENTKGEFRFATEACEYVAREIRALLPKQEEVK